MVLTPGSVSSKAHAYPAARTIWTSSYFTGSVWPVAIYVMAMAVITLVSLYFLRETHQRDINDVHLTSPDGKLASHDLSSTPTK